MNLNFYEITPSGYESLLEKRAMIKEDCDFKMMFVQRNDYNIQDNVAHIHVFGPLLRHASELEMLTGVTSYKTIENELLQAIADNVDYVVLTFDSPGGEAMGSEELVEMIASCPVPVYGLVSGICASAAMKLASACTMIFATKSSEVGSIGSIIILDNTKAMMDDMGIKRVIFTNNGATYKGLAQNFGELTEEEAAYIQKRVDESGKLFQDLLKQNRPEVSEEVFNAQMYRASEGIRVGLIDGII